MGFEGCSIFSPNWKSFNPHLWGPRHQPWWILVGMSLQVYTTYNYLLVTPDQEVVTVRQSVMLVQWSCTPEVQTVTHVKVLINHTSFEISLSGITCQCSAVVQYSSIISYKWGYNIRRGLKMSNRKHFKQYYPHHTIFASLKSGTSPCCTGDWTPQENEQLIAVPNCKFAEYTAGIWLEGHSSPFSFIASCNRGDIRSTP